MTIPLERTHAVLNTERFLKDLTDPKVYPKIPKRIRGQAAALLRHYPTSYDLLCVAEYWNEDLVQCPFANPNEKF